MVLDASLNKVSDLYFVLKNRQVKRDEGGRGGGGVEREREVKFGKMQEAKTTHFNQLIDLMKQSPLTLFRLTRTS